MLIDNDETAYHDLATALRPGAWRVEVTGAPEGMDPRPAPASLRFRVFAGPQPYIYPYLTSMFLEVAQFDFSARPVVIVFYEGAEECPLLGTIGRSQ